MNHSAKYLLFFHCPILLAVSYCFTRTFRWYTYLICDLVCDLINKYKFVRKNIPDGQQNVVVNFIYLHEGFRTVIKHSQDVSFFAIIKIKLESIFLTRNVEFLAVPSKRLLCIMLD